MKYVYSDPVYYQFIVSEIWNISNTQSICNHSNITNLRSGTRKGQGRDGTKRKNRAKSVFVKDKKRFN